MDKDSKADKGFRTDRSFNARRYSNPRAPALFIDPYRRRRNQKRPKEVPAFKKLPDNDQLWDHVIREASENAQVNPYMCIQSGLGALSAACQNHILVQPPTNQEPYPVSLYLLTIAESGTRKTTVEGIFFSGLRRLDKKLAEEYKEGKKSYQAALRIWSNKMKGHERELTKLSVQGESTDSIEAAILGLERNRPEDPIDPRFIYEDITRQALLRKMQQGIQSALLLSSEADTLLNGIAFQESTMMNSLWTGSPVKLHRSTQEDVAIDDGRMTMALQIQPSGLEKFVSKRGKDNKGSGLLARFLTIRIPKNEEAREIKEKTDTYNIDIFNDRVEKIAEQGVRFLIENKKERRILFFSREASIKWIELYKEIEENIINDPMSSSIHEFFSKKMENISRISALIHMCNNSDEYDNEIKLHELKYATALCESYTSTYLSEFLVYPDLLKKAIKLYDKLHDTYHHTPTLINDNDIYRTGILRNKDEKYKVYNVLQRYGALTIDDSGDIYYTPINIRGTIEEAFFCIKNNEWGDFEDRLYYLNVIVKNRL